jgi:hypothetical protein
MAHERKSFFEPFFKNKVPMIVKQPPTFFFQEAHNFDSGLVQGLRTMSLAKAVPKGIRDKECGLPYENILRYPTCQRRILSKKRFLS